MAKPDFSRLVSVEALLAQTLPPIQWDVEPLIARHERVVVYGEFDSLKSWIMLHLGLCFATGLPVFDLYDVVPRSVLYLDEEMNLRTSWGRLKRMRDGLGNPAFKAPFEFAPTTGFQANAMGIAGLLDQLNSMQWSPDVLIMETLRRVLPGEENSQQDISRFWQNVTAIARDRMTVIVSHHMRKPQHEGEDPSRDRASGSTDILAGCDAAYAVERVQPGQAKVECVKIREAEPPSPCIIALTPQGPPPEGPQTPLRLIGTLLQPSTGREVLIARLIASQPQQCVSSGVLEKLAAEAGISRAALYRHLLHLEQTGKVLKPGYGVWSVPPPKTPP